MGAKSETAGAAAAGESPESTAGAGAVPPLMMGKVFAKLGQPVPAAVQTASEKPAGDEPAAEETPGGESEATTTAAEETPTGTEAAGDETPEDGDQPAAGEGDETPAAPTDEHAAETAKQVRAKLKDLPEAQRKLVQSVIDERIAQITGKAKADNDRLGATVTELTAEVEQLRKDGPVPVQIAGVHPALLAETPAQIDQELDKIEQFIDWADLNRDGYNLPDSDNYDPKQPTFTAEQIRARLREVNREKDRVLPQARQKLADRASEDAKLKAVLPALFDPRSAEFAEARKILAAQPHLRSRADQNLIIAQQILGAKALQQLQRAAPKPGNSATNAGKSAAAAKPPARRAPRAPGDGAPAFGSPLDRSGQQPAPTEAVEKFTKDKSRAGLKNAVRGLMFA